MPRRRDPTWTYTPPVPNPDGTWPTYYPTLAAAETALAQIPEEDRAAWCREAPFQSSPPPSPLWRIARRADMPRGSGMGM